MAGGIILVAVFPQLTTILSSILIEQVSLPAGLKYLPGSLSWHSLIRQMERSIIVEEGSTTLESRKLRQT